MRSETAVTILQDNFLQRDTINLESLEFCYLPRLLFLLLLLQQIFWRGCAITHHNLADSLAVIDGKGGIVWANFGQLTKVDTAREM